MEVETKNASLDTMAVTIQALHVSGKQMTLAVFRQLPWRHICDNSGNLNEGLRFWGKVRYQLEKEGQREWPVADCQGQLVRCVLPFRPAIYNADDFARNENDQARIHDMLANNERASRILSVLKMADGLQQLFIAV